MTAKTMAFVLLDVALFVAFVFAPRAFDWVEKKIELPMRFIGRNWTRLDSWFVRMPKIVQNPIVVVFALLFVILFVICFSLPPDNLAGLAFMVLVVIIVAVRWNERNERRTRAARESA